jgi:hypothetical protein
VVLQHNLVNHAFNTILIHLKPHIGIKSNPGDSTGSGLFHESPADLEFDSSDSSGRSAGNGIHISATLWLTTF